MKNKNKTGIVVNNLVKIFGKSFKALDDVTLHFPKNEITGLIGFNGSGKTTIFNILSQILQKNKGECLFDGKKINLEIRKKISYLAAGAEPRNSSKAIVHLKDLGELYGLKKKQIIDTIYKYADLLEFKQFLNKPIKSLSKGNQQKIKIIQVFLNPNMEYLFLDEPFDGLDPIMVEKVKKIFIDFKNITIVVTSHRMDVVQSMCNDFYVLKKGKIIDKRNTKEKTILVEINKEIDVKIFEKLDYIISIKKDVNEIKLILKSLDYYKNITKFIVKNKNFKYISLKNKNIADAVFKGEL